MRSEGSRMPDHLCHLSTRLPFPGGRSMIGTYTPVQYRMKLRRQLEVDIHYKVSGDGEPVFLLFNGASLPLAYWDSFADRLRGTVIRFDQRNAGETTFAGRFTLADIAADANALLQELDVKEVVAIGHAWGGRAAQVFARDYPSRLTSLVICGTGGQYPPLDMGDVQREAGEARRRGDRAGWEAAFAALYCGDGFATREPVVFSSITDPIWNTKPNRDAHWDVSANPSASYWGTATMPTLLIYGEQDKNGTPRNAHDLHARIPGSELLMIPGAGHFAVREAEDIVLAKIHEFTASPGS